jgi:4-hydroxythreonine-4-phosphate dehydrogenase
MTGTQLPTLGLVLGDRNGIGPEIAAKLLAEDAGKTARAVVIGDPHILARGCEIAGVELQTTTLNGPGEIATSNGIAVLPHGNSSSDFTPGQVSGAAGTECLDNLAFTAKLAGTGVLDGMVFAPLNKASLHAGGMQHEDETRYLQEVMGYGGAVGELNVMEGLWTSRVTSHVPLKDVAGYITGEAILEAVDLLHGAVQASGIEKPRLGLCALNPHAGDGGNFGREEIDVIAPAVAAAQGKGLDVSGPWPSDTVFIRARNGDFDGVVTMYHDQGQIAMKLMGFGSGVTVAGGLPVPVTTCAHGTAFDIAGQGVAGTGSIAAAWDLCARMAAAG